MLDYEIKIEKPELRDAYIAGATMGVSYFIGIFSPFAYHYRAIQNRS